MSSAAKKISSILCLLILPAKLAAANAAEKVPVPDDAAVEAARQSIRQIFADEYRKESSGDKRDLAEKLIEYAGQGEQDKATQYAMLQEAVDVATKAKGLTVAIAAIDALDATFEIDALAGKADVVQSLGRSLKKPKTAEQFTPIAINVARAIAAAGEYRTGVEPAKLAQTAAKKSGVGQLLLRANRCHKDVAHIERQDRTIRAVQSRLERNPDDRRANFIVGRFECLIAGRWQAGLPKLAKADNEKIRQMAELEQAAPQDPAAQKALADAWFELADKQPDLYKHPMLTRALHWYEQGLPQVEGLEKVRVDKRIDECYLGRGLPPGLRTLTDAQRELIVRHKDKFFLALHELRNWANARQWCLDRRGTLACVANEKENLVLQDVLKHLLPQFTSVWIGGSDAQEEGVWRWEDGAAFRYTNWIRGEPNNSGDVEHAIHMRSDGQWNDMRLTSRAPFIAQWSLK